MKRIKIIVVIATILLFTGCSVNYNITINSDSSVNVKVVATESSNTLKVRTNLEEKEAVEFLYKTFKVDSIDDDMNYSIIGGTVESISTASFKDLDDFSSKFSSDIYDRPRIKYNGDLVTVSIDQIFELSSDISNSLIYDGIEIDITIPFKVTKHNADRVSGNTYVWNVKKDGKLYPIDFTYDKSEINSLEEKSATTISIGSFELNYYHLIIIGLIVIALIITVIVLINNKKNNKV